MTEAKSTVSKAPLWFPNLTMKDKNKQFLRQSFKESSQRGVVGQRLSQEEAFQTYFSELVIFEGYTDGRLSIDLPSSWISITVLRDGREQGHTVNHPESLWFVQEQKSCRKKKLLQMSEGGKSPETIQLCPILDLLLQTPYLSAFMSTVNGLWINGLKETLILY